MKRTTLLLLLATVLFSFGYTKGVTGDGISKIYLIGSTLIRTTPGTDIRLYDIANPAAIGPLGTIAIEGNSDVAATGDIMYADRGPDLVVFDISNPSAPQMIDSVRKVFEYMSYYAVGEPWEGGGDWVDDGRSNGSVIGGMSGCGGCQENDPTAPSDARGGMAVDAAMSSESSGDAGQAGSLARFMIVGDYLYCIDMHMIKVFDISEPTRPRYLNMVDINWGIETIFHDGEHLFIGGQQGMYIYSIEDPVEPEYVSEFTHVNSCDPVVVDGDRAYVTLRGGSACNGYSNQLDILDISNITSPTLLRSVPMDGPYGLAARDGMVMVCDGQSGMKTMNTADLNAISKCGGLDGITAYDVIWYGDLLIVTAEDGFWLYNASDPCAPTKYGRLDF